MAHDRNLVSRIKEKVPLSVVLERYLTWDKHKTQANKGEYWASCPFHNEKSASFHVRNALGYYYCFGCHAKGDALSFLIDNEKLTFREALEELAQLAGEKIPTHYEHNPQLNHNLYAVLNAAFEFFLQKQNAIMPLLAQRNVNLNIATTFGIGFAPPARNALCAFLLKQGFSKNLIIDAGLALVSDYNHEIYDRFRNRIMFPVHNNSGKIISFAGRALENDAKAKYLNGSETELFHKGDVLFNMHRARVVAAKTGRLIVCEGYFDVTAMHSAGFAETVAPMGTALTEAQLQLMWRHAPEPIILFDGDTAGSKAAMRVVNLALPLLKAGKSLKFAFLPHNTDPDDFIRQGGDISLLINKGTPLSHIVMNRHFQESINQTPEHKAMAVSLLKNDVSTIADFQVRSFYETMMHDKIYAFKNHKFKKLLPKIAINTEISNLPRAELVLLGMIINAPEAAIEVIDDFATVNFANANLAALKSQVINIIIQTKGIDFSEKMYKIKESLVALVQNNSFALRCISAVPNNFKSLSEKQIIARLNNEIQNFCMKYEFKKELSTAAGVAVENGDFAALDRVRFLLEIRNKL